MRRVGAALEDSRMKRTQIEKRVGFALVAVTLGFWGAFMMLENPSDLAVAVAAQPGQDRRLDALPLARVVLPAPWESSRPQR